MVYYAVNGILSVGIIVAAVGIIGVLFYLISDYLKHPKSEAKMINAVRKINKSLDATMEVGNVFDFEQRMDLEGGIKGVDSYLKKYQISEFIPPDNQIMENATSVQAHSFGDVYFENTIDNFQKN